VPETLMVRNRHYNGALVIFEDEPLSLRELCVPLRGPEFDLSLFQRLKFWAGHLDLFRDFPGRFFDRIANPRQQFSDRHHIAA